jgi:hypothetical protein
MVSSPALGSSLPLVSCSPSLPLLLLLLSFVVASCSRCGRCCYSLVWRRSSGSCESAMSHKIFGVPIDEALGRVEPGNLPQVLKNIFTYLNATGTSLSLSCIVMAALSSSLSMLVLIIALVVAAAVGWG